MLVSDVLRLATRMFRTNRSRTILTILGISVGIGAILFLVSLGYGLQYFVLNSITNSDALLSLDVSSGDLENLKLNQESIEEIAGLNGVDKISPLFSLQAQMTIEDISSELIVNFTNSDYFRLDGTVLEEGNFYTEDVGDKNKIIISSTALQLFNLSVEEAFSKKLEFTLFPPIKDGHTQNMARELVELEETFEIVGIIEEEKVRRMSQT